MPYIHLRCNKTVTKEQETVLKSRFGEAIALLPGKSERWLMVDVEDGARLWLAGEGGAPLALLEVEIFGKGQKEAYDRLTEALCQILAEVLAIPGEGVYVKYAEKSIWGYNGFNF